MTSESTEGGFSGKTILPQTVYTLVYDSTGSEAYQAKESYSVRQNSFHSPTNITKPSHTNSPYACCLRIKRTLDMHRRNALYIVTAIVLVLAPSIVAADVAAKPDATVGQERPPPTPASNVAEIKVTTASVEIVNISTQETQREESVRRNGWVDNATAPTNETVFLSGLTNLRPDDHAITVDVLDSEFERVALATADQWGTDGVWTVEINTTGMPPGEYTVEATAAGTTDQAELRVVEAKQRVNVTDTEMPVQPSGETENSKTDSGNQSATTPVATPSETGVQPPAATETSEVAEPPTEATGAGFGLIPVLIALTVVLWYSHNN